MPYYQTVAEDTNSSNSTPWLKNVFLSQPAGWSQVNQGNVIVQGTHSVSIKSVAGNSIVIESMAGLASAISDGKLQIRSQRSHFGSQSYEVTADCGTQSIMYPIINYSDTGTGTSVTFDTINSDNIVTFDFSSQARLGGRTLNRRNHRGGTPRALSVDFSKSSPSEITALQLLRQLVGKDEFRRYLKYGFVMVRGGSRLRYQIRRNTHTIDVWDDAGKRVASICVYLDGNFPPTDETITRMLMAENDELSLWHRGNVSSALLPNKRHITQEDLRLLHAGFNFWSRHAA